MKEERIMIFSSQEIYAALRHFIEDNEYFEFQGYEAIPDDEDENDEFKLSFFVMTKDEQ